MEKILISWIGTADLTACENDEKWGKGPVLQAINEMKFNILYLFADIRGEKKFTEDNINNYLGWLKNKYPESSLKINIIKTKEILNPMDFEQIFNFVDPQVDKIIKNHIKRNITFYLSPGTPAMQVIFLLLNKAKYPEVSLIESSKEHGVNFVNFPFKVYLDIINDEINKFITTGIDIAKTQFSEILSKSEIMEKTKHKAFRFALFSSMPILIEGESGTGKELFAKAIHYESDRKEKPFEVINCGAIPENLIESELFGYVKGAFTGATTQRSGAFARADKGTLFLDEIGELPLYSQVKLLRVLQEKVFHPLGDDKPKEVDVRIISATNRNLFQEIKKGNFRQDLFYRIAGARLVIPPLRERENDTLYLIEKLFNRYIKEYNMFQKKLSESAINLLKAQPWRGNVRELDFTLRRLIAFSENDIISEDDVKEALYVETQEKDENFQDILQEFSFENPVNLEQLKKDFLKPFLIKAFDISKGNKTNAAKLLGIKNYQTFDRWCENIGLILDEK